MQNSKERVSAVLEGKLPDRPPLFDLIRNDAIISHFAGRPLTMENAADAVPRALHQMLDSTRPKVRLPQAEREEVALDGRRVVYRRWTEWKQPLSFSSADEYARAHRARPDEPRAWGAADQERMVRWIAAHRKDQAALGNVFLFWNSPANPGFLALYDEVGLEQFSYYLADCPDAVSDALERNTAWGVEFIAHLPPDLLVPAVFLGDDIAAGSGTLCSPAWLQREYFPRLKRVVDAWHRRDIKVLYHSDGNLMSVLDDLAASGVDGLNPIETAAGMDIAEIHRRHPHLFLCGGIDVSRLLPFGTPAEVRDATTKAIEDADGRLMVGSSTEIHDSVPLENYLAMVETALHYRYP